MDDAEQMALGVAVTAAHERSAHPPSPDAPLRFTTTEIGYLNSILRMLRAYRAKLRIGPSIQTEALDDNVNWLDMFIGSAETVEVGLAAIRQAEEDGYAKGLADGRATVSKSRVVSWLHGIIDNARLAYAETHPDDETRCRAMAAALHEVDALPLIVALSGERSTGANP